MKPIITEEQAENFINNYDLYKSKAENQTNLFTILEKCESLAIASNNNKLLSQSRIFLTNYYIQINDLENALKIGLQNKIFAEEHKLEEETLRTYSGLIEIYNLIGDYAKMEQLIREYQEKLIDKNDYTKLCTLYIILAMQAHNLKNYDDILKYNQQAIEYGKISNNPNILVYAYSNFGYYFLDKNIDIAKEALENASSIIKLHQAEIPIYSIAIVDVNLSKLYLKLKNYKLSYELIKSAIKKLQKIDNNNELNAAKLVLSELHIHNNKLKSALVLLNEIEIKCTQNNNKSALLSCYECYIKLYEKKKKYKEALEYYKKYQVVNEEIYNEETNKKIHNLQTLYEVTDLKRQRDHAKSIANLKHDFLANMSHEIRSIINIVLGVSYLLQQSKLDKEQQDYVQRLHRSGESLLSLINDILDISKIDAGKMELRPTAHNLHNLLHETHQQLIYKAEEKKLIFTIKCDKELNVMVLSDANRLNQIILNLLSNAIKFTSKGFVKFEIKCLSNDGKNIMVEFTISDSGIGIPENKINLIFERYEQATSTNFGGTGLGLSISKKLAELMNGKVTVESKQNIGTKFKLTIPFEIIKNNKNEPFPAESNQFSTDFLHQKRILIADDMQDNRLIFREILLSFHPKIITQEVCNGNDVLKEIKEKTYDLILMDLDMPKKNGIEAMLEIRKIDKYKSIKIMAHTSNLISMTHEEIIEIGFDDLLLKPFSPKEFLKKLTILLS